MTDEAKTTIRAGDHVHHAPSGEDWVIGRVSRDGYVEPFGWPRCRARANDCTVIKAATDEEHAAAMARADPVFR